MVEHDKDGYVAGVPVIIAMLGINNQQSGV
jgi:hypothetical protein